MRRLAIMLMCALSLSAFAADYAKPNRQETFGDVTVYYNAFASSTLSQEVAAASDLTRSKQLSVLNITVLKAGKPLPSSVNGTYKDLTGRPQPLTFKQVSDKGWISYIAQFPVKQAETYTFNIDVKAGNEESHSFSFNQDIYPGE
ncbi:homoserine acetyltransferase [Pseudomonas sp. S25]|uniref:Homoserine acetyltransferase n=1 Tax=Pseudomonas maioricensis TaxID=1766623 RepID=A0ABS9ZD82_9PSED|nr:DUF4426 domain-containing protein [Pseudomonas sp. S25]MCI8208504.1 homoserine acetyltransferase [Pseudomonas sp. S25]